MLKWKRKSTRPSSAARQQVGNMKQNVDIPLASIGITAPIWLEPLNLWLGLVLVSMSIVLVGMRIWAILKENK